MVSAMKRLNGVVLLILLGVASARTVAVPVHAQNQPPVWTAKLDDVRTFAAMIPGARPLRINILKFAESHRTTNFSVKSAAADPSVQARTVFGSWSR